MKERCRSSTRGCVKCCFHEYQMCDLGRGETVMEANYFWQSWLSVCFHGKVHSQRHEHSPTASDCSPLDPSLVKCYFEISMWDLCFDSGASNVTLCWSSRENLNSCRITIATIVVSWTKKKAKKKKSIQFAVKSELMTLCCCSCQISSSLCQSDSKNAKGMVQHCPKVSALHLDFISLPGARCVRQHSLFPSSCIHEMYLWTDRQEIGHRKTCTASTLGCLEKNADNFQEVFITTVTMEKPRQPLHR